tara:strand:- start:410 stop:829 length:420 start_codon:yes stop_codon:yes gene_type:complete
MSDLDINSLMVGQEIPSRSHTCDHVQLFFYNAILWNAHRIHYDLPYATEVEGYPGLVIAGPQIGDWMVQCADNWIGNSGMVVNVQYSNRLASYLGETLVAGGSIEEIDLESREIKLDMHVKNADGDISTPGSVTVRLNT